MDIIHNTRHHRTTRANNGRQIDSCCCHNHTGNNLIAVGYQYQTIKAMCHCHGFHTICNEFTAGKAVFHADMSHGNAVANTNGRHFDGGTASHTDTSFYGFCYFIQMKMSGNNFTMSRNYANQRTIQFFFCIPHGIKQAAHRLSLIHISNRINGIVQISYEKTFCHFLVYQVLDVLHVAFKIVNHTALPLFQISFQSQWSKFDIAHCIHLYSS